MKSLIQAVFRTFFLLAPGIQTRLFPGDSSPVRSVYNAMRVVLTIAAIILGTAPAAAVTVHVFLVGGQSNADGRASSSELPPELQAPQTDVPFFWGKAATNGVTEFSEIELNYDHLQPGSSRTGGFGPEVTFGRAMADFYALRGEQVAIIKHAQGGTTLSEQWRAGGDGSTTGDGGVYQVFQQVVSAGLTEIQNGFPGGASGAPGALSGGDGSESVEVSIEGMIWMQGESDATDLASAAYEDNLRAFIEDVRATYGANLPFTIGQLSSNQTDLESTFRERVRAAQAAVATSTPYTSLVNTNTFGLLDDDLHFNAAGQIDLGLAFASQIQPLIAPEPSTAVLLLSAAAVLGQLRNRAG